MAQKTSTVQLRIVAESQDEATQAVNLVIAAAGDKEAFAAFTPARAGRKGQWLAYGTLTLAAKKEATRG